MASDDMSPVKRRLGKILADINTHAMRTNNNMRALQAQFEPEKRGAMVVVDPNFIQVNNMLAEIDMSVQALRALVEEYKNGV